MRTYFVALNTGYFSNGSPTDECIRFYAERCRHGLDCAIVGNVVAAGGYPSNSSCGVLLDRDEWYELASVIEATGTMPGIQIASAWPGFVGQRSFVNNAWCVYESGLRSQLRQVNVSELFDNLMKATETACKMGFRHIQLHAAHGYLLSSLIDPTLSTKPFVELAHNGIRKWNQLAKSLCDETSVRVSWYCGFPEEREAIRQRTLLEVVASGIDVTDLSEGYYNKDKNLIYPSTADQILDRRQRSISIARKYPKFEFIISGRIYSYENLPENVNIGICRDLVANPDYLKSFERLCKQGCNTCHYYSNGMAKLTCEAWREDGHIIRETTMAEPSPKAVS